MTTPPCRCGHPSHYHGDGYRPYPCKNCDCPDFWPSDKDIAAKKIEAVRDVELRLIPPEYRS